MLRANAPCSSSQPHDSAVAECGSWCSPAEATHHCTFCKCQACSLCTPTSKITHVYASAGSRMVACDEGALLLERSATLQQCKDACDAVPETACKSFTYDASERHCSLRSSAGEPKRFCARGEAASYWRVDLGTSASALAAAPVAAVRGAVAPVVAVRGGVHGSSTEPRRALVQGARLVDSATGAALQLHGLNLYIDYMRFDDMALMRQLLPTANFVRLVGVFWHDVRDLSQCSCCTEDESRGFFAESCLEGLKNAITTSAYPDTYMHAYMHTRIHAYITTGPSPAAHSTRVSIHSTRVFACARARARVRVRVRACARACARARACVCARV